MSLLDIKATAVVNEMAKVAEFRTLADPVERPILDFLKEIFKTLLPLLIGCFGVANAPKALRNPGPFVKLRLRREVRNELQGHPQAAELHPVMVNSILFVGHSTTDAEFSELVSLTHSTSDV